MHLTKRHRVWGMGMDDFEVLWVWGFCGDFHWFFCGYGMDKGLKSNAHVTDVSPAYCWLRGVAV